MQLENPMQMNDWPFRKFVSIVVSTVLIFWGVLALQVQLQQLLPIRAVVGIAFILFLPGICVLRALRVHRLGSALTTLYSVGISCGLLMVTLAALDVLSLQLGFEFPMSLIPIGATITALIGIACAVSYKVDRGFVTPCTVNFTVPCSPPSLLLFLLLLLAVLGCMLVNSLNNNLILLAV